MPPKVAPLGKTPAAPEVTMFCETRAAACCRGNAAAAPTKTSVARTAERIRFVMSSASLLARSGEPSRDRRDLRRAHAAAAAPGTHLDVAGPQASPLGR